VDYFDMDLGLNDEDRALRQAAHKFAGEVMRPAALTKLPQEPHAGHSPVTNDRVRPRLVRGMESG